MSARPSAYFDVAQFYLGHTVYSILTALKIERWKLISHDTSNTKAVFMANRLCSLKVARAQT